MVSDLFTPGNGSRKNIFSSNYTQSSWIIRFGYALATCVIQSLFLICSWFLASFEAAQNGHLTQQRVNRSNTSHSGFHLWPRLKERVPSYGVHPPRFATTALLPLDHLALNTARLEREREREKEREVGDKMAARKRAVATDISSSEDSAV